MLKATPQGNPDLSNTCFGVSLGKYLHSIHKTEKKILKPVMKFLSIMPLNKKEGMMQHTVS